jgi:hypothetical protein
MATLCSDSNPLCGFCGETFDEASLSVASISMLSQGDLLICKNCHVITTLKSIPSDLGPQGQARFHELIFGTAPTAFSTYINDAKLLRTVITSDYPDYFGNKASELIFEVGAGRGSLLKAFLDEGYSAIGCEYSVKLVEAGRAAYGLPDSVLFQLNAWDLFSYLQKHSIRPTVLVFWHVIEHVENSLALLESLIKVCADNITLIFQTPLPVPEYVYPEHLFFPSTETYHFIAKRLGLAVKLLYVIPYTRFVTCVLSNKDVPQGKIFPKQVGMPGFSILGQLISQLDSGLQELDQITKDQFSMIVRLESQISTKQPDIEKPLTLAQDLSQIADFLRTKTSGNDRNALLKQQMQQLVEENQGLRNELLRAGAQLELLKDILLNNLGENSL